MTGCLPEHLLTSLLLIALPLHIVDPQSQVVDFTFCALEQHKVGVVSVRVLHKSLQIDSSFKGNFSIFKQRQLFQAIGSKQN